MLRATAYLLNIQLERLLAARGQAPGGGGGLPLGEAGGVQATAAAPPAAPVGAAAVAQQYDGMDEGGARGQQGGSGGGTSRQEAAHGLMGWTNAAAAVAGATRLISDQGSCDIRSCGFT